MPEFEIKAYLASRAGHINGILESILSDFPMDSTIKDAMAYSLLAGGKRIRPILCIAAAEAVGKFPNGLHDAAAAIECIHTYSLIHDDLPAMDNDDVRRGKPTNHVAFDEATAILAGDGLLTLAFNVIADAALKDQDYSHLWLSAIQIISKAAGHCGMIEGQMRDTHCEGQQMSVEQIQQIHSLKTGALITASVQTGAILSNATDNQFKSLTVYAENVGLAFQVIDDILNVEGDPQKMGKAVGTDRQKHKNTYPALLGLDQSKAFSKKLIDDALQALDNFDKRSDPLREIARYVINRRR